MPAFDLRYADQLEAVFIITMSPIGTKLPIQDVYCSVVTGAKPDMTRSVLFGSV